MVAAVSSIKSKVMFAAKEDGLTRENVKNDYERTPDKDTVTLKDKNKSSKGWIIGVLTAVACIGLYFITKGKKGTNTAGKVATNAVSDVKIKKPEPSLPAKTKTADEPELEVLKPDKIIIPKKTKHKHKNKAEKLKSSPSIQDVIDIEPVLGNKSTSKKINDVDNLTGGVDDLK